jgi:predicted HTH transcriptional regulator
MSGKRSINPIDILEKLDWHENNDLEFKSAKGGVPKSVWETYSAMANTHGGVILLGVENDGTVSGVIDPDRLKKSFWDTINNRGKVSVNLLVEVDVAEVEHEQGVILAIRVPLSTACFSGEEPAYRHLSPQFRRRLSLHRAGSQPHAVGSGRRTGRQPDPRTLHPGRS